MTEKKIYNIKLPSDARVVTPKNIWRLSNVIADTGKVFTVEDLVKNGSPINEKNLFRLLSYMRYLGLINEKREKTKIQDKSISVQKWVQNEKRDVDEFFFLLQDKRPEEAKKIYVKLIKNHDIFQSIKQELMKNHNLATEVELKDYLRHKLPGKKPNYYNLGTKFVISLFEDCGLVTVEGNKIKLVESEKDDQMTERVIETKQQAVLQRQATSISTEHQFIISIHGKDINFTFPINEITDFEDIEIVLKLLKKRMPKKS